MNIETLKDYKLVWSDEFDGDSLDNTKWTISEDDVPKNNEDGSLALVYSGEKESVRVENGSLCLQNRFDEKTGLFVAPKSVNTKKTMSFKYGYLEVRAKIPFMQGTLVDLKAFAKGAIGSEKNVPYYSQMNIIQYDAWLYSITGRISKVYENYDKNSPFYKLNHYGEDMGPIDTSSKAQIDGLLTPDSFRGSYAVDKKDEFLTCGFLWTENEVEIFVEGRKIIRINLTRDFIRESGLDGFRKPHYLEFQNSLKIERVFEKVWLGFKKDDEETNENEDFKNVSSKAEYIARQYPFEIDYVRLYQKDGEGELNIN
ncbi:MAG: hypothetical protein IJP21_00870 [Clostridia bacterium]|nr:hypothetical protein [Clostridia bacterium]